MEVMFQDYLTGILNRMGLYHAYEELDTNLNINVLFFDIDNFKTVNDVYGHKKGDEVLMYLANILSEKSPDGTVVARLGGDEFVAIIPSERAKEDIAAVADSILGEVRKLKNKDKACDVISSSIGIILNYETKKGLDEALSCADKAMYYAKEQGKDTFVFYDDYAETIKYENTFETCRIFASFNDKIFTFTATV